MFIMSYRLFNRISDAIEILQAAQREGENAYIEAWKGDTLHLVEPREGGAPTPPRPSPKASCRK